MLNLRRFLRMKTDPRGYNLKPTFQFPSLDVPRRLNEALIKLSDFSVDADSFLTNAGGSLTVTGNVDAIATVDDCLKCLSGGGSLMQLKITGLFTVGNLYRAHFDYYLEAVSGLANLGIGLDSARVLHETLVDNIVLAEGVWKFGQVLYWTADNTDNFLAAFTTDVGDTGDTLLNIISFYLKNVRIDEIDPTDGKVLNSAVLRIVNNVAVYANHALVDIETNDIRYAFGADPVAGGLGHLKADPVQIELIGPDSVQDFRFVSNIANTHGVINVTTGY